MVITPTRLAGVWLVDLELKEDERGVFARTWCRREFGEQGLPTELVQCNLSRTRHRGTIRGIHWQASPHEEDKLVRCTRGAIWDVAVDLRPESPTYLQHVAAELTAESGRGILISRGFGHGFQTLEDDTEVVYGMSAYYEPAAARGARWDDPAFGIPWPIQDPSLHPRDASYPDFHGLA